MTLHKAMLHFENIQSFSTHWLLLNRFEVFEKVTAHFPCDGSNKLHVTIFVRGLKEKRSSIFVNHKGLETVATFFELEKTLL